LFCARYDHASDATTFSLDCSASGLNHTIGISGTPRTIHIFESGLRDGATPPELTDSSSYLGRSALNLQAPVNLSNVVANDVLHTGANVIATRTMPRQQQGGPWLQFLRAQTHVAA
jgi:hypothetical protein